MTIAGDNENTHHEQLTGHTAAILEEIPAMFCDGLLCLLKLRIAGKRLISSQHVAGPLDMCCILYVCF